MRQIESDKLNLILALKETPIVLAACKKLGVPPSTYYRWRNDDKRFAREATRAIARGREPVSDIAEAHLIQAVKKGDMRAVLYWLKVFRTPYKKTDKTVIEVKTKSEPMNKQPFTPFDEREPRKRKNGALLPSIDYDEVVAKADPKLLSKLDKILKTVARKFDREELLRRELLQRGCTNAEIEELLKGIGEF